jgi:hypothetical protein
VPTIVAVNKVDELADKSVLLPLIAAISFAAAVRGDRSDLS